jgi:pyrophosphatase PpaX
LSRRIEAVLFDLDGTLLDTSEFIFGAFEHTLARHEREVLDRETMGKMMGRALSECYEKFAPGIDPEELMQRHRIFQSGNKHLVKAFPGAKQLLKNLKKRGYKVGIVTSRVGSAQESMDQTGISKYVDVLIDSGATKQHKPHPEPVEAGLKKLQLKPEQAVVVGDGDADVLSGKAAGVITIGVTYGMVPRDALEASKPDYLLSNINEIEQVVISLG